MVDDCLGCWGFLGRDWAGWYIAHAGGNQGWFIASFRRSNAESSADQIVERLSIGLWFVNGPSHIINLTGRLWALREFMFRRLSFSL